MHPGIHPGSLWEAAFEQITLSVKHRAHIVVAVEVVLGVVIYGKTGTILESFQGCSKTLLQRY